MKKREILVVGAGLYGCVYARELTDAGHHVTVIDRRPHIAGNAYTEEVEGIAVHRYGPHIFHTNDETVWNYVNRFASFNRFTNAPVANYHGTIYSLPFNMYTFNRMWGVVTPNEARERIARQREEAGITEPKNLEETAISLVGKDVYETLVRDYTAKQWGRKCKDLPSFIIKRLPVRFTYDNNYFNARFQGIPYEGYTALCEGMLQGIAVRLSTDFSDIRKQGVDAFDRILYTGPVDEYFDYALGTLAYRSLRFETTTLSTENYQGNAIMNFTDAETPYTRIIEHRHFNPERTGLTKTVISKEYSVTWKPGDEPYYPVNDDENNALYEQYRTLAKKEKAVRFGGRLGLYRYYDMDVVIAKSLNAAAEDTKKFASGE